MINKLLSTIDNILNLSKPPLSPIPPSVLLIGANKRPGLIASEIVSNIISRKGEVGIITQDDVTNSITNGMELIRVEEILNALITNAKIEVVIPMGVPIQGVGSNAGGPVTVIGTTMAPAVGYGIIR